MSPAACFVVMCVTAGQVGDGAPTSLPDQLKQDFRERLGPGLETFGAGKSAAIQTDRAGLQIRLSVDRKADDGAGVATRFRISGDFEITLAYDLLSVPKPETGFGAGVKIWSRIGDAPPRAITFAHFRRPKSDNEIVILVTTWDADDQKSFDQKTFEGHGLRGRMRLSRSGSRLRFAVANGESDEFRELQQSDIGTEDVQTVRIEATTSKAAVPVSIRLRELEIRADKLSIQGSQPTASSSSRWWWTTGLLAVGALSAAAVWRLIRNRRARG